MNQQLRQRQPKHPRDMPYLRAVRSLPCVICDGFGEKQNSVTQAHHVIHGRHGTNKTPDRMAIPLCEGHHKGDRDTSKIALHREPDMWREAYGLDVDWIAATQDKVEALT